MAEIARLSVALEGDTSDFESALSAVERGLNKAASVAVASGGSLGGIFNTAGAGAVAMGSLIASGVTTAAGALTGLGQSALSAVVDFEKMQAQMTAMTAVELVDQGKFADFNAAYDTAVVKSKELLDWSQKLAVVSPYEGADVARVSAAAQAFGFLTTQFKTAEEAQRAGVITVQRLTEGILNFGAATGKSGATLDNISMIAGQIKAMGKLQGGDSMQLKNMGINLEGDIAAKLGITTAAVVEMREKGLIPADLALNTLMANLEKYGSAAEKQGNSLGGLMASLSDLAAIAQRDLFGGIFRSLQPKIAEAVTALQNPAFKQALVGIGESAGAAVTQALDALGRLATGAQAAFAAFQAGMATAGVGGGVFNVLTMLGVDEGTAATVGAVLNGIVGAVQTGIQAVQAAIAGFASGGVSGGVGAFLTSLGLDASLVSHVQTVLDQIGTAIQTGVNALRAAVAGFASGGLAGGASGLLEALGIDPAVAGQVASVMGQIGSAVQTGIGVVVGVISGAANLISQNWTAIQGALAGIAGVVAGFMAFQGVAAILGVVAGALGLLLSPIGLVVGAAALIGAAWATNFGNIQGVVAGLIPVLTNVASIVGGVLVGAFNLAAGVVGLVIQNWSTIAAVGSMVGSVLSMVGSIVGGVLVGAFQVLSGVIGFVAQNWQIFAAAIGGVVAVLAGSGLVGIITGIIAAVQGLGIVIASAGGIMGAITTVLGVVAGAFALPFAPILLLGGAIAALAIAWATNAGNIQGKTQEVVAIVMAQWNQLVANMGALGAAFQQALTGDIGGAFANFQSTVASNNAAYQNQLAEIQNATTQTATNLAFDFNSMGQSAQSPLDSIKAKFASTFGGVPADVGGGMGGALSTLNAHLQTMMGNTAAAADNIRGQLSSIASMMEASRSASNTSMGEDMIGASPAAAAANNRALEQRAATLRTAAQGMTSLSNAAGGAGAAAGGAAKAAKTAEEKIQAANQALQSTIQTVTDLNEMLKSGLAGLTIGDGADQIVQLASQVAQLGRRMFEVFSAASAGLTEDSGKAAGVLSQGIGSAAQGLSSVIGLLPKLWEFMNSPEWGEMQGNMGAVIAMAAQLSSIGRQIYDVFSAAAAGVSEESAKAAQAAAAGIGAASQALTAIVGLLPKLWEFINDPAWDEIQAAQGQVIEAAAQLSQLGVAIFNAFSAASGGISEESSKAAQAAAAGIQAATGAISSIIDTVKKIVDFTADVGYAAFIFTEEGRGHVMAAASALISLGVEMFNQFAAAASGISAKAIASAKRLGEGLKSMGDGVSSVVDAVVKLSSFMADGMNNIHVNNEESRGAIITMTGLLASLGKLMLDQFALAASQVSSLAVAAAKRLSEGLQAVTTGITSVIDAVAKMSSFMADGMNNVHMNSEQSRNALITMAHFLAQVGREIYNQFVVVSVSVAQLHVDAAKRLSEGVKAASDAMTATMGLVTAMSSFMANTALAAMVAPGEARQALFNLAIHLSEVAREIYNQFVNSSVLVSQYHVDAAKRLAEGVQAATSALTATLDLVDKLMTATTSTAIAAAVAPGPLRDALFALVQNLSIFAREVYNQWVAASVLVSQYHVEAARRLADGAASAMQAVGSAMDMLGSLFRFAGDKVMMAIVQSIGARQWFARLAAALGQFVEDVLEAFDTFGVGVSQDVVDNAARLGAGAEAASQIINASIGALTSLFKFAGDAVMMSIVQSAGARTWFANLGAALGQFVEDVLEAFDTFDVGIAQNVVDRAERLGQGADAANQILTGAVGALTSLFKFASDAAMVAVVSSQSSRESYARLGAALGQFVEDALEAFDTFDVSVTQAMVDSAQTLSDGASALAGVLGSTIEAITHLAGWIAKPIPITLAMTAEATRLGMALVDLFTAFQDGIGKAKPAGLAAVQDWADASGVFSALEDTMGIMTSLRDWLKEPIRLTANMQTEVERLGTNLTLLFYAMRDGIGKAKVSGLAAVQAWADVSGVFSALTDVMDILRSLHDWLTEPVTLTANMEAEAERLGTNLTLLFYAMRDGIGKAKPAGAQAVQDWADLSGIFSALQDVMGILPALAEWVKSPVILTETMTTAVTTLTANLTQLFYAMRDGIGKAKPAGAAAVQAWADVSGILSSLQDVMGFLPALAAWVKSPVKLTDRLQDQVEILAANLVAIFEAFRDGARATKPTGVEAAQAWADTSSVIGSLVDVMGFLPELAEWVKSPVALTDRLGDWVGRLAGSIVSIFEAFRDGAETVKPTGVEAAQAWADTSSVMSAIQDAMGFLPELAEWVKSPVTLTDRMLDQVQTLAGNIVSVFRRFSQGAGLALPEGVAAAQAWADTSSVVSGLQDVMGFLPELAEWTKEPVTLTDRMLDQVSTLASNLKAVFTRFRTAVGDAKPEAEGAVKAWSDIFGSVMDGLSAGFGLTELSAFLTNFTGFNFAVLGPKLDLLIANLIEVARRFGTQAANSGIQEAWATAASRVSGLFSDASSSLNEALSLGAALLDPETQIPSLGQIQGKVDALFNIIQGVAAQFAARATAAANAGMNFEQVGGFADTVKSVFGAIREVAAAVADFTGVSLGASGFNNIAQVLNAVFTLFEQVAGRASVVNQVSAAIASVLGGLANMVSAQSYQAGVSIGQSIAAGIAAGLTGATGNIGAAVVSAVTGNGAGRGAGTPGVSPGGGGAAPSQTVYNAPQNYSPTFISITNTNPAVQADVTNQAILLKSQFGAGL